MRPRLSQKIILDAVERDFGRVSMACSVSEGEESQAFGIRVGAEDFIVRANRSASGFHKDAFCYRQFTSPALPIPEILFIGQVEDLSYCISRRAPGITLQDMPLAGLPAVVSAVARTMQAIAEAPVPGSVGFGQFDADGMGEHTSWSDFIAVIADPQRYDWGRVEALVSARWLDEHLHQLRALLPHCPEIRRLVHGDFGSNNVMTDGTSITGVLDWSEAMFGDPLYDVANIFFWRPWLACMEAQAHFFEEQCPNMIGDAQTLGCYQLRIGLAQVYDSAVTQESDVCRAMKRCEKVIAELAA
jgi:hygromycin-B 4-O-kinase